MTIPSETTHYLKSFLMCSTREEDMAAFDTVPDHEEMLDRAFRLLSRYDEYEAKDALDTHSRFLPEQSWLARQGLLQRPVLDEYTEQIYGYLHRERPQRSMHVYLTHDIDSITRYRRPRGCLGGIYRSLRGVKGYRLKDIVGSLTDIKRDPDYTFPLMQRLDARLPEAEVIYFVKPQYPDYAPLDRPVYSHKSRDYRTLTCELSPRVSFGLHSLYRSYDHPESLVRQNEERHKLHRAHYLRLLPPQKMRCYCEAGITEDFSMAYASAPGFRTGTTRPHRCIDPATGEMLQLVIHPLTIMDTTLSDTRYLGLSYEQAYELCVSLIDTVRRHQGDVTLLFHNSSFNADTYHERLYGEVIEYLRTLQRQ